MKQSSPARGGGFSSWLVRGLSRLVLLLVVFVIGALAMHFGMHAEDRAELQARQSRIESLQAELSRAQADLAAQRSEAEVQAGTQRVLQDRNAELQQELGRTRDQLAFYEQLIPPGPAGAVAVRAFDIQADGEFLRYRVLLTRNAAPQAEPFKGRMRFVANGRSQGKAVKIELSPPVAPAAGEAAASAPGADPLALVFDQFQRSTGVLQRVPDLSIQSVRLEILEGDTVRASQDADLNRAVSDHAGVLP
ncbi:Putative integral membrane protein OS=Castellaniella defragrans (strain DSM / CCUG 39792 / 65Phen)OX=1437824 GN=BN940_17651 PE=4 SV=1 [Castellaniella denitrificans]|uniref:DUF6776 family protein n=1 Tax=Castellaniella sp. TaxID=1955812 RepID=UPI002AFDE430|nr:DUF6776 family protein [Castellaniella sp.]